VVEFSVRSDAQFFNMFRSVHVSLFSLFLLNFNRAGVLFVRLT